MILVGGREWLGSELHDIMNSYQSALSSDGHDQIMIDHCNYDLIDFIDHGTARS